MRQSLASLSDKKLLEMINHKQRCIQAIQIGNQHPPAQQDCIETWERDLEKIIIEPHPFSGLTSIEEYRNDYIKRHGERSSWAFDSMIKEYGLVEYKSLEMNVISKDKEKRTNTLKSLIRHNKVRIAECQHEITVIKEQLVKRQNKRSKQEDLRALATANTEEVRSAASTVKRKLGVDHDCPYCGLELGHDYHADHIYPVAKGGKSTFKNMVNVCRTCNSKKVALTLGVFCRKFGLNRDAIELSLDVLGKDF